MCVQQLPSEVTGTACVSEDGEGIIFTGSLKGLEDSVTGAGFHIHSGTSCDDNTSQGGHYYKTTVPTCGVGPDDPWTGTYGATYTSTDQGEAAPSNYNPGLKVGEVPFTTSDVDSECGVKGHTVIVHRSDGVRIGCGVLM
mmetsp:Transcript_5961/g.15130  ORF Transcript_5961/g.15130 Transcript_5961/m.15130 type:complete len:140 (-) Transcript_5961:112-531(-)